MYKWILFMFVLFVGLSCSEPPKTDLCKDVTCSGHGTCYVDHTYYTRCACEDGYYPQGNNCLPRECKSGYELNGETCEKTCTDCSGPETYPTDPCAGTECSGFGFCNSDPDRTIYCSCYPGYKLEGDFSCVESKCDSVTCAS